MKRFMLFSIIFGFLAALCTAGVEWHSRITITDNEKGKSDTMTSKAFAQDGDVKQAFSDVPRKQRDTYIEKGYWLYRSQEDTLYIVDDKEKTITVLSLDGLMQMSRLASELVKIDISDHSSSTRVLDPETVMGYRCTHVKIVSDYTMSMKVAIIKKSFVMHEEKEIWSSPEVQGVNAVSQAFLRKDFRTGFAEVDRMIEKEVERMKDLGFPLKTVVRTIQKNRKGRVKSDSTTTTEVTKIQVRDIPASFFELPEGYTRNEAGEGLF